MTPPANTAANEFVQFYGREAWTDWQRLLAHFDLGEGFAFLVLLLPGAVGADICRRQLAQHLRTKGKRLEQLPCEWREEARRLPERLFAVEPAKDLGGIWLGTVIPESDPEIEQWQQAWRQGLSALNERRNPLKERFSCPLVLVGAPWLHTLLREAAPDLWSIRTGVVSVTPSSEPGPTVVKEPGLIETAPARLVTGEAAADPDYALEQAERLRDKPGKELARAQLLLRAGNGFYEHARPDSAQQCLRAAADLFAVSAANNPDVQASWAGTLNNLANVLSDLGRREEALAHAQDAVRLYRQLAEARPDAFLPNLAMSLNNLANRLSALGRREEALAHAQESVRLDRQLAEARPDAFLPDLAGS
ncbi:MAG: tetratricopeptide repeat protein, partial [Verrucomicrobiota bacterium]